MQEIDTIIKEYTLAKNLFPEFKKITKHISRLCECDAIIHFDFDTANCVNCQTREITLNMFDFIDFTNNKIYTKRLEFILAHEIGHLKYSNKVYNIYIMLTSVIPLSLYIYFTDNLLLVCCYLIIILSIVAGILILVARHEEIQCDNYAKFMCGKDGGIEIFKEYQSIDNSLSLYQKIIQYDFMHPSLQSRINNLYKK